MSQAPAAPDPIRTPSASPGHGSEAPTPPRRTRVAILLTFLGTFLLLVIVFRAVLFPFLMAIFIAYLIEPVVAAFTRTSVFGVRWTRGPTIVLMYVLVLSAIVLSSSCAVTTVARTVREVSADVGKALAESSPAALFVSEGPAQSQDLRIPAGTRVVLHPLGRPSDVALDQGAGASNPPGGAPPASPAAAPEPDPSPPSAPAPPGPAPAGPAPAAPEPTPPALPTVYETLHVVHLSPGEQGVRVLLKALPDAVPGGRVPGDVLNAAELTLVDGSALPPGLIVRAENAQQAKGLELWLEGTLIGPIQRNLAKAGFETDPREVREFIRVKQEAFGADLGAWVTGEGTAFAVGVAKSLYMFLLILMLTAFIVMDRKRISAFFASLPPDHLKPEYGTLMRYVDRGLAGVIRGQLVICGVNGLLTYVGLLLLGVPGAALLSLVAGVLSLIPIFGTIVSSIPIVLAAATAGLWTGALALGWIMFIHLLEANVLNPLIMGSHANMHPVVIVFALLAGEHSFGVWGALLAVPTMSILQSCFLFYRHEIEGLPRVEAKPHGEWLRKALGRILGRSKPGPTPN